MMAEQSDARERGREGRSDEESPRTMPKSIIVDPRKRSRKPAGSRSRTYRSTSTRATSRPRRSPFGVRTADKRLWYDMVHDPRVRDRCSTRSRRSGAWNRGSRTTTAARRTCPSGRKRRRSGQSVALGAGRPHLRLAPQPRRDPGQGPTPRSRKLDEATLLKHHEGLPRRRRPCGLPRRMPHGDRAGPGRRTSWSTAPWPRSSPRKAGFNRGLGGSMHAFFTPFGIYAQQRHRRRLGRHRRRARRCSSAINRKPGIVIANIGDASMGCGPVWEGMLLAAMDQYRTLWDKDRRRRPADALQLHEQLLRHGRPDPRRDHGLPGPRPHRRRRQPRQHARRARGRLQPAGRGRRRRAARRRSCSSGQGPGPAGHHDLPHLRPLALGRLQLPHQGGDRALAGGRRHRRLRPTTWSTNGVATPRPSSTRCTASVVETAAGRGQARGRSTRSAPDRVDGDFIESRHVLQRQGREAATTASRPELLQPLAENARVKALAEQDPLRPSTPNGKPVSKNKAVPVPRRHLRGDGSTASPSTRPWRPAARRTATGAAPSPSTAA